MNKTLATLSLARRAGKLAIGFTATKNALMLNQVSVLVTTKDISPGTKEKIVRLAKEIPTAEIPYTSSDIEEVMKRKFVVAAITDKNFKELFRGTLKGDI